MKNTYRTSDEVVSDKTQLGELLGALNASPSALRRDECEAWILRGRAGCYASTWGDGVTWHLVVAPEEEMSKQAWTWIKKRLSFCEVIQDGDAEGCFRLHRLPTVDEAEEIRNILGIRKRVELSEGQLENLRRWSFEKGAPKGDCLPVVDDETAGPVLDPLFDFRT